MTDDNEHEADEILYGDEGAAKANIHYDDVPEGFWRNALGLDLVIAKMTPNHLINALTHAAAARWPKKVAELTAEIEKRGLDPAALPTGHEVFDDGQRNSLARKLYKEAYRKEPRLISVLAADVRNLVYFYMDEREKAKTVDEILAAFTPEAIVQGAELNWEQMSEYAWAADTPFGVYVASSAGIFMFRDSAGTTQGVNLEEAKELALQDYRTRLIKAIFSTKSDAAQLQALL